MNIISSLFWRFWMALIVIASFMTAATPTFAAYELSDSEILLAENVAIKLEKIFEKKSDQYRTKIMMSLEKLQRKTNDSRKKALIRHVIDTLDKRLSDEVGALFESPAEIIPTKTRADLNVTDWFQVVKVGKWKIDLSWNNVTWAVKYNVRYGAKLGVWKNYESETGWISSTWISVSTIGIKNLSPGKRYYFAVIAKNIAGDESARHSTELSAITPPSTWLNAEKRKMYEDWITTGNSFDLTGDPGSAEMALSYYEKAAAHYWGGQYWLGLTYEDSYRNWNATEDALIKAYAYLKASNITALEDDVLKTPVETKLMDSSMVNAFNTTMLLKEKMTPTQLQKADELADSIVAWTTDY